MPTPHLPALALPQSAARGGRRRRPALQPAYLPPRRGCGRAGCNRARQPHPPPPPGASPAISHRPRRAPRAQRRTGTATGPDAHRGRVPVVDRRHRARRRSPLARDRRPQPRHRPAMAVCSRHPAACTPDSASDASRQAAPPTWSARRHPQRDRARPASETPTATPDLPGLPPHPPGRRAAPEDPGLILPGWRLTIPGGRQGRCRATSGGSAAARGPREPTPTRRHRIQARRRRSSDQPTDRQAPPPRPPRPTQRTPQARPSRTRCGQALDDCRPRRTVQTRRRG